MHITDFNTVKTGQHLEDPLKYAIAKIVATYIDYERYHSLDIERRAEYFRQRKLDKRDLHVGARSIRLKGLVGPHRE